MSRNDKTYVILRKTTKIKPTEIPKSLYVPETFVRETVHEPIRTTEHFEQLSRPKPQPTFAEPDPIPKYENEPPQFQPVDYRVTEAQLARDLHILHKMAILDENGKDQTSDEFYQWQEKMKAQDEEKRKAEIQKRREDLDNCRRRASKAKKEAIAERLEIGKKMRIELSDEIKQIQAEIEAERERIRELKHSQPNLAPISVEKMKRKKIEESRKVRAQVRADLKLATKLRSEEINKIKENAARVRDETLNHTNRHGDAFIQRVEISGNTFLASLSDEEATELVARHRDEKRKAIEAEIEEHRKQKEAKMTKLVEMLNEATKARESREEEHARRRKEKAEREAKEAAEREAEEEQKMLDLEKRLEKKRNARIREAEEMEEHTREIDARNRYLALNKKALSAKAFQSQQDGKLRAARERQAAVLIGPTERKSKAKPSNELKGLKGLLGV